MALEGEVQLPLERVVDEMPAGVIIADADGRILYANRHVDQIWRQPLICSRDISDYAGWKGFHPDGRPYLPEEWPLARSLARGEAVESEEIRILRGDGTIGCQVVSSAPVRDASGRIIGGVVTFFDTTERHLAEARLSILYEITTELQRAQTIEHLTTVFLDRLVQPLGAEIAFLARQTDGASLDILGSQGMHPQLRERYATLPLDTSLPLFHVLSSGEALWMESADELLEKFPLMGELGPIVRSRSLACIPLRSDATTIGVYALGFVEERKFSEAERRFHLAVAGQCAIALQRVELFEREESARREAERALAARDEFLAIVSHEIRTPLTTILGWADMLLINHSDPEMVRMGLESIRSSAYVQRRVIDDLLDATRMLTGSLRLEMKDFDGRTLVEAVVTSFRPDAVQRGVDFAVEVPHAPIPVYGDSGRLAQVLTNLVSNALKFTPAGGAIRICAAPAEDCLEIRVSDTGAGIDPEFLPLIFERFVRGERSRDGLGLGLAIARHIVTRHGGMLEAHSDGKGRGATFTVRLPCAAQSAS